MQFHIGRNIGFKLVKQRLKIRGAKIFDRFWDDNANKQANIVLVEVGDIL